MKANVTKKMLSDSLSLLERVIPSRSSNPILTSLKVQAEPAGLTLVGTNFEMDLSCFVPAEVNDSASFLVPAHLFSQIVRRLGGELVELELEEQNLSVRSGGTEFKIHLSDLSGYPEIDFPKHADVTFDAAELAQALSSVRYAASNDTFQAVFRGIMLEHRAQTTRVVASDSYRIAIRDFASAGEGRKIIIPAKSADELIRILKDGQATFTYGEGFLTVHTEKVSMNLKLLDGEFPDYERAIPKEARLSIKVEAHLLREAVARVAILTDKIGNHRIEFLIAEGILRLAAEADYGNAQDSLEVVQTGEPAMTLSFNAKYLSEALSPIDGEVELSFSGPETPAVLRPISGEGYTAVITALKV